jgi:DNA repair photolyase
MRDFGSQAKSVGGNEGDKCNYSVRLDTYGCGCAHDCSYCYAKSLLEFRGLWNPNNPSIGDISQIAREVRKLPRQVVRLGGMTDCFQPAERLHKVTYKTIKLLNRRRIPYLIITKSPLIAEDDYIEVMDKNLAHIQFTLTFTDDNQYKQAGIEKAPPPSKRIEVIEKLESNGFDTCIRLSPYIPEFINIDTLNNIECDKVLVEFLRVNHWIRKWLGDKCDLSGYTRTFHGYDHLPFERKKQLVDAMGDTHTITVCDFEPEYIDYWKKQFNPNKNDCCNLRKEF